MGGSKRKKRRTHRATPDTAYESVPRSFVLKAGVLGASAQTLVRDFRKVMLPYTAARLKERNHNKMSDVLKSATALSVSHLMLFKQTEAGTNVRFARVPHGPTLQFRVSSYSLIADVVAAQAHPRSPGNEFKTPPLVVLNNFTDEERKLKLAATMFQNMFPAINLTDVKLSDTRRVVLFNYVRETDRIDIRHYLIRVAPVGVSKSIKRLIETNIPDLTNYDDISDYILREAQVSDSEAEDADNRVTLPQNYVGRGNTKQQQRGIRLIELGPRLQLELLKIQKGFCDGDVLYHELIHKTPEEIKALELARQQRDSQKAQRRRAQEENVRRKEQAKAEQGRADRVRVGLPAEKPPKVKADAAAGAVLGKRSRATHDDDDDDADADEDEEEGEDEEERTDEEGDADQDDEDDEEEDEVEEEGNEDEDEEEDN